MNKIRKEILEKIEYTKNQTSHPEEFLEFLLEGIMDIVNDYVEDAFYDSRDRHRPSMCDWKYIYEDWDDYKKSVLECEDKK